MQMSKSKCEAPRPQGGASRTRSGEHNVSKGNFIHIVPLDPAYKAGLAGHAPAKGMSSLNPPNSRSVQHE
jgi:hypothetical protein